MLNMKALLTKILTSTQKVSEPKLLSANTNLLNLGVGEYTADNNTTAATIVNSPTQYNFKCTIFWRTTSRKTIILTDLYGDTYIKVQQSATSWSNWFKLTKTTV